MFYFAVILTVWPQFNRTHVIYRHLAIFLAIHRDLSVCRFGECFFFLFSMATPLVWWWYAEIFLPREGQKSGCVHPGPFLFPAQQGSLPHGGPGILTTLEKGNLTNYWTSKKWANVTVFLVLILKCLGFSKTGRRRLRWTGWSYLVSFNIKGI